MTLPNRPADLSPEALRAAHLAYVELAQIVARALTPSQRTNPQREYPEAAR